MPLLTPRIAVVGFGAAGLGFTNALRRFGRALGLLPHLTVFEGMNRWGGKVAPHNLGAQFLDASHFYPMDAIIANLRSLGWRFRIDRRPDYDLADFQLASGQIMAGEDFLKALQRLRQIGRGYLESPGPLAPLDRLSAPQFLTELVRQKRLTAVEKEVLNGRLLIEEGTRDISALAAAINLAKSLTPMERLEIQGGLYRLFEAEAAQLAKEGHRLRPGQRVTAVERVKAGVRVFTSGGQRETFDRVLLAVSPEHLPHIRVAGSDLPLEVLANLRPARIVKSNLTIRNAKLANREIATPSGARWRSGRRQITYFHGFEDRRPLSRQAMLKGALHSKAPRPETVRWKFHEQEWDVGVRQDEIPHGYTTMPRPGEAMDVLALTDKLHFTRDFDGEAVSVANHVIGLGCYTRDAALAGEFAALHLARTLGLSTEGVIASLPRPARGLFLGVVRSGWR